MTKTLTPSTNKMTQTQAWKQPTAERIIRATIRTPLKQLKHVTKTYGSGDRKVNIFILQRNSTTCPFSDCVKMHTQTEK